MARKKNPAAVALGKLGGRATMQRRTPEERIEFARKGGRAGGRARAESLTPEQRREIGRKAARARWQKARREKAAGEAVESPTQP